MKNVQIYPCKVLNVPNDRISKTLFNLTENEFRAFIEQQSELQVTEIRRHKRFGEITTPAIIYRALTGKIDKGTNAKIHVNQLAAINHSLKKLMARAFTQFHLLYLRRPWAKAIQ